MLKVIYEVSQYRNNFEIGNDSLPQMCTFSCFTEYLTELNPPRCELCVCSIFTVTTLNINCNRQTPRTLSGPAPGCRSTGLGYQTPVLKIKMEAYSLLVVLFILTSFWSRHDRCCLSRGMRARTVDPH